MDLRSPNVTIAASPHPSPDRAWPGDDAVTGHAVTATPVTHRSPMWFLRRVPSGCPRQLPRGAGTVRRLGPPGRGSAPSNTSLFGLRLGSMSCGARGRVRPAGLRGVDDDVGGAGGRPRPLGACPSGSRRTRLAAKEALGPLGPRSRWGFVPQPSASRRGRALRAPRPARPKAPPWPAGRPGSPLPSAPVCLAMPR